MAPPVGDSLPVVDLAAPEAAAAIRAACEDYGFFFIVNHGISLELMNEVLGQVRAFFALPLEAKESLRVNRWNRGYMPSGTEYLDRAGQAVPDTKEAFYLAREVAPDSPESSLPLHGPNQWPGEDQLPGWRDTMERYSSSVVDLGMRVTRLLCASLGLPDHHLDGCFDRSLAFYKLLHYPPQVTDPSRGVYGTGAHTDWGALTFLLTDGTPGLEVCLEKEGKRDQGAEVEEEWVEVPRPPVAGGLLVNVGDLLRRWTNDSFKSIRHRVVMKREEHRYSVPFFFEVNYDTLIDVLPGFPSPPKYPPILAGDYLLHKIATAQAATYTGPKGGADGP